MSLRLLLKRDIVFVVVPKAANGTATLALNLYAVHFLVPADFGALTLCTTLLVLLDGMVGAAIDLSVVKLRPLGRIANNCSPVERAAIGVKSLGCIAFAAVLIIFAPQLGMLLLHRPDARPLFVAWSVAATAVLALRSTQLALQIRERYGAFACIELLNTALRIGFVIWAVHHGFRSSLAIITCFAFGSSIALAAGLVTLIRITGLRNWWGLSGAGLVLRNAGNALVTYGLSAFASRLDILILAILIAPTQLGLYGSAMTLATIPEIAATYLAPAFLPRIDAYCKEGIFAGFFLRFHLLLYCMMGIGYAAVLWLLPRYGGLILPAKYAPAIAVTLVLLPGTLATASIFPLSLNLLMLRSSRVFIYFDLLMTPLLAVAYILGSRRGILTVAAITTAARILKTLTVQFFATRAAEHAQTKHLAEQQPCLQPTGSNLGPD